MWEQKHPTHTQAMLLFPVKYNQLILWWETEERGRGGPAETLELISGKAPALYHLMLNAFADNLWKSFVF